MGAENFMSRVQKPPKAEVEQAVDDEDVDVTEVSLPGEPVCTCAERPVGNGGLMRRDADAPCLVHGDRRAYLTFEDGQFR